MIDGKNLEIIILIKTANNICIQGMFKKDGGFLNFAALECPIVKLFNFIMSVYLSLKCDKIARCFHC